MVSIMTITVSYLAEALHVRAAQRFTPISYVHVLISTSYQTIQVQYPVGISEIMSLCLQSRPRQLV